MANGWQNLDSIMDALFGAAGASAIAGASEVFAKKKTQLKNAAPVGGTKKTVHFADPIIAGGKTRKGGRTRSSINWTSPDIDIFKFGDSGRLSVEANLVMAPQGFYQDGPPSVSFITPKQRKKLGWMPGIWATSTISVVGGSHRGWIGQALSAPVEVRSRVSNAFSRQFTAGGNIRVQRALVLREGFADNASTGAWFDQAYSRSQIPDLAWRRAMQARSRRALGSWESRVNRAIGRLN